MSCASRGRLVEKIHDDGNLGSGFGDLKDQPFDEVFGKTAENHAIDVHGPIAALTNGG